MKVKVTQKELKKGYNKIISIGYCDAWYLLAYQEPRYYTCGVYGWSSDNYHIDNNTLISTGYRPLNGISNYDLVEQYNEKARTIYISDLKYEAKKKKVNKLLDEFINELLEREN